MIDVFFLMRELKARRGQFEQTNGLRLAPTRCRIATRFINRQRNAQYFISRDIYHAR